MHVEVESSERQQVAGRLRAQSLALLLGAFALAELTPLYVSYAAPHVRAYLMNPMIFGSQAIPYVVCGLLWLPWRSVGAAGAARIISIIVFAATLAFCVPSYFAPGKNSGDMIGIGYLLGAVAMTSLVLTGSLVAFVVLKFRGQRHQTAPRF